MKRLVALACGALLGVVPSTFAAAAPRKAAAEGSQSFDKAAATAALAQVDLAKCKVTNAPKGENHVTVMFANSGMATSALVDKGPLIGSPVAKCVQKKFMSAHVPAFKGDAVQVGKTFRFE